MKYLITHRQEVEDVIKKMSGRVESLPYNFANKSPMSVLKELIDNTRKSIINKKFQKNWHEEFVTYGALAICDIVHMNGMDALDGFSDFILEKHKHYGAEPFEDWKEVGIIMRLGSKINRILNLRSLDGATYDSSIKESANDTVKDILGYCILGCYLYKL